MSPRPEEGIRSSVGALQLTGEAERLWLAWILHLRHLLHEEGGLVTRTPALIAGDVVERSGYAQHFPQNVLRATPLAHTPASPSPHASASPSPRASAAPAPELVLSPASCLHVYGGLAGSVLPDGGLRGVVHGPCARYEGGTWNGSRLSTFTMLEWVALGSAEQVDDLAGAVSESVTRSFEDLDLSLDQAGASDPFFEGERSGPALLQKVTGAKVEWRTAQGTAVGSVNRHGAAYGTRFAIEADGEPAHSACVAFGIERLVLEGLRVWGGAPRGWPRELREHGALP